MFTTARVEKKASFYRVNRFFLSFGVSLLLVGQVVKKRSKFQQNKIEPTPR